MTDKEELVDYDELNQEFKGEKIESGGILVEVESVRTASADPNDSDARYTLDVRAYRTGTGDPE